MSTIYVTLIIYTYAIHSSSFSFSAVVFLVVASTFKQAILISIAADIIQDVFHHFVRRKHPIAYCCGTCIIMREFMISSIFCRLSITTHHIPSGQVVRMLHRHLDQSSSHHTLIPIHHYGTPQVDLKVLYEYLQERHSNVESYEMCIPRSTAGGGFSGGGVSWSASGLTLISYI